LHFVGILWKIEKKQGFLSGKWFFDKERICP
jgi:hypothetical protein